MNAGKGKLKKMKTKMPLKQNVSEEEDSDKEEQNKKESGTTDKKEVSQNPNSKNFEIVEQKEDKHAKCASCDTKCVIF